MSQYRSYFPVALNLTGRLVAVVGGSEEATRKVESIIPCGARVLVISPSVSDKIEQWARWGKLMLWRRGYRRGDLEGVFLAIVCEPGAAVAARAEADERGVLLNVEDQSLLCDFVAMATFSRDGLQFAVHSSGRSAALSRRIRERLEARFGESYGEMVRILGEMRPVVHGLILSVEARRRFWLEIVNQDLLDRIENQGVGEHLREEILKRAIEYNKKVGENAVGRS